MNSQDRPEPQGLGLVYWFFMVLSFATTGYTITTMLPDSLETPYRFGLAYSISLVIQAIIGATWPNLARLFRQRSFLTWAFVLFLGIGGSIFSGILASSTNTLALQFQAVDENAKDQARLDALQPVLQAVSQADTLSRLLDEYSNYATAQSAREKDFGDSCEGGAVDVGEGPLTRLRANQAEEAALRAGDAGSLVGAADQLRTRARAVGSQDEISALFLDATKLSRAPYLDEVRTWVEQELGGFRGDNGFLWESKQRVCRDSGAVRRLEKILTQLDSSESGALLPPSWRDARIGDVMAGNFAAMGVVFDKLSSGTGLWAALSIRPASLYVVFWVWSLIVEMTCVVLGMYRGAPRRKMFSTSGDIDPPSEGQMKRGKAVAEVLDNLVVRMGRDAYLLVPVGGFANKLNHNARTMARNGGRLLSRVPASAAVPLEDILPPSLALGEAERIEEITGSAFVDVYKIRNLSRLEQKLVSVLGFDDSLEDNVIQFESRTGS